MPKRKSKKREPKKARPLTTARIQEALKRLESTQINHHFDGSYGLIHSSFPSRSGRTVQIFTYAPPKKSLWRRLIDFLKEDYFVRN
jgi:hypothetical protein